MADHLQDGRDRALSRRRDSAELLDLCRLEDIPDGGAKGFYPRPGASDIALFIVRRGAKLYSYKNSCPHLGSPLEMCDDQFLSGDGRFILCSTHGAIFRIEDGHCLAGPCAGKSLERVEIDHDDAGRVRLSGSTVEGPPPGGACHRPMKV